MPSALTLTGVTVARSRRLILDAVTFQAGYGSVLAILGPNGAGKTTLLETLAGFHAFQGEATLDDTPLRALAGPARARRLAYVPQISRLDAPMVVRDVVAQGRFAHNDGWLRLRHADHEAIDRALQATDTARLAERLFTCVSAGERRRVLVARALATGAKTLLLDEPSASLDIAQALSLFQLIRRLAHEEGHAVIVVLHHLDEALRCADRALLLDGGRVVAWGRTEEVVAVEPVRRVYDVELIANGGLGYRKVGRLQ